MASIQDHSYLFKLNVKFINMTFGNMSSYLCVEMKKLKVKSCMQENLIDIQRFCTSFLDMIWRWLQKWNSMIENQKMLSIVEQRREKFSLVVSNQIIVLHLTNLPPFWSPFWALLINLQTVKGVCFCKFIWSFHSTLSKTKYRNLKINIHSASAYLIKL